jgi:hypothetical protein
VSAKAPATTAGNRRKLNVRLSVAGLFLHCHRIHHKKKALCHATNEQRTAKAGHGKLLSGFSVGF